MEGKGGDVSVGGVGREEEPTLKRGGEKRFGIPEKGSSSDLLGEKKTRLFN